MKFKKYITCAAVAIVILAHNSNAMQNESAKNKEGDKKIIMPKPLPKGIITPDTIQSVVFEGKQEKKAFLSQIIKLKRCEDELRTRQHVGTIVKTINIGSLAIPACSFIVGAYKKRNGSSFFNIANLIGAGSTALSVIYHTKQKGFCKKSLEAVGAKKTEALLTLKKIEQKTLQKMVEQVNIQIDLGKRFGKSDGTEVKSENDLQFFDALTQSPELQGPIFENFKTKLAKETEALTNFCTSDIDAPSKKMVKNLNEAIEQKDTNIFVYW